MSTAKDFTSSLHAAFQPSRCLSEQQLMQYRSQQLPEIELHLLEQHLVECELCSTALELVKQPEKKGAFITALKSARDHIQQNWTPSPQQKADQQAVNKRRNDSLQKEKKMDVVLQYVWTGIFILAGAGGLFWLLSHKNTSHHPFPVATAQSQETPANIPVVRNTPPANDLLGSSSRENEDLPKEKTAIIAQRTHDTTASAAIVKRDSSSIPGTAKKPVLNQDSAKKKNPSAAIRDSNLAVSTIKIKNTADTPLPAKKTEKEILHTAEVQHANTPEKSAQKTTAVSSDEKQYTAAKQMMRQGNWDGALNELKPLGDQPSNPYYEGAQLQMARCYDALGRKGKAKRLLKRLVRDNGAMKEEAEKLLSSL